MQINQLPASETALMCFHESRRTEWPVFNTLTLLMMQHITLINFLIDFYQAIVCDQTQAEPKQISCEA